jgi:hypothetical protein
MANSFSYLTDQIETPDVIPPEDPASVQSETSTDSWSPQVPWSLPSLGGNNPWNEGYWTDDNAQTSQLVAAGLIPFLQAQQSAYQYGNDFTEAQRRWNSTNAWAQTSDQFQMNLAAQQQALAGWSATTQADQWNQQFAAQGVNDQVARQVALGGLQEQQTQGAFNREQSMWGRTIAEQQQALADRNQTLAETKWLGTQELEKQRFAEQHRGNLMAEQLAQRQIALQEATEGRKLDQNERKMVMDQELAKAQLAQREAEMKANSEAARVGAFGRRGASNPGRLSFWG